MSDKIQSAGAARANVVHDNRRGGSAPPCDAHHHGDNDGDLHGADDGGDEDVVELLSAGNHVEDVELLGLVALKALVPGVTPAPRTPLAPEVSPSVSSASVSSPAGGGTVSDLALPVNTGASLAVGAGDGHAGVEAVTVVHADVI